MPTIDPKDIIKEEQEGEVVIPTIREEFKDEFEEKEEEIKEEPEEEAPFKTFKTQEEYDTFMDEERKKLTPVEPKKEEKPSGETPQVFDPSWKPKDWNDFAINLLKNPKAHEMLSKDMATEVAKEIGNMTKAEREEMEKINKAYDDEYSSIAKKGLLPTLDTDEGKKVDQQISMIGATYGLTSITKAYELWKKIPISQGGGLEYIPPKKAKLVAQKQRSGLVSGKNSPDSSSKKQRSYEDIHKKSLDDLMDEENI